MKILGAIGMVGAVIMIFAGVDMARIVSQATAQGSAPSIAEVFYNAMGWGFIGLGIFCIMLICVVAFREVRQAEGGKRVNKSPILDAHGRTTADYDKAVELDLDNGDAYCKRGDAYEEMGEYGKAIADYSKAIELDPNHALAYFNRGCAYGEIGKYEEAIADYSKAIELNPNDALAYYNRGLAYHETGDVSEAVSDLEKCIGLSTDPELTNDARQALAEIKKSP